MPRRCTICYHAARPQIEDELEKLVSHSQIAKKYGVSRRALGRHLENHMEGLPPPYPGKAPPTEPAPSLADVKATLEASQTSQALAKPGEELTVMDRLETIMSTLEGLLTQVKGRPASVQLPILREMRFQIELLSKLLWSLRDDETTDDEILRVILPGTTPHEVIEGKVIDVPEGENDKDE